MQKIVFLIGLLLLNSCMIYSGSTLPPVLESNVFIEQRFPDNKKSLIIVKDQQNSLFTSSLWYRIDESFNGKNSKTYLYIPRTGSHQVIMIEPGTYSLASFGTSNSSYASSWIEARGDIYNVETKQPNLASFEVKSGEVVYLGDINMISSQVGQRQWGSKQTVGIRISVANNYSNAKEIFLSKYPTLKQHEVKLRMIKTNEKN